MLKWFDVAGEKGIAIRSLGFYTFTPTVQISIGALVRVCAKLYDLKKKKFAIGQNQSRQIGGAKGEQSSWALIVVCTTITMQRFE